MSTEHLPEKLAANIGQQNEFLRTLVETVLTLNRRVQRLESTLARRVERKVEAKKEVLVVSLQ